MEENLSYLLDIPADEYHAATKAGAYVSSHQLHRFRICPELYHKYATGEVVDDDTESFIIGRALHLLVLGSVDVLEHEFAVANAPINKQTGKQYTPTSKVYKDWAAGIGKPVISIPIFESLRKFEAAVHNHEKAAELLSAGFAEKTIRTKWCGVDVQARPDWFCPARNLIVDLKTCNDVDTLRLERNPYGYIHQLAFYAHCVNLARGGEFETPECWIIAVEKKEPYRVAVYKLRPETIEAANFDDPHPILGRGNEPTLCELVEARLADKWISRYEGFGVI